MWSGRSVAVAGGTGFIGSALAQRLVADGADVTIAGRSADPERDVEMVRHVRADLTDLEDARRTCAGQDIVFLVAALDGNADFKVRHAAEILTTNSLITLNGLRAALDAGVRRVVLVSSSEVYATTDVELLSDKIPVDSISNLNSYALSKVFGEVAALKYVEQFGLEVVIGRPANVYGPGDDTSGERGRVIARWISAAAAGKSLEIWGTGNEARSYIFVSDVVSGLLRLGEVGPVGQPVNLAHRQAITLRELAEVVCAVGGFDVPIVLTPLHRPGVQTRLLDTSLASSVLGFEAPTDIRDGLRITMEHMFAKD